jgi:hypothetical protein
VRSILDYDPKTGIFRWRARADQPRKWNTRWAGKIAGSEVKGYIQVQIPNPKNYYAHVLAWLHVYGEWRPREIDHRNRNRADNRIDNLRIATESQNGCNKSMQRNNTTCVIGIYKAKGDGPRPFIARIYIGKKKVWQGSFATLAEAQAARRAALPLFHGEFAAE